jgi:hypothetical protein
MTYRPMFPTMTSAHRPLTSVRDLLTSVRDSLTSVSGSLNPINDSPTSSRGLNISNLILTIKI